MSNNSYIKSQLLEQGFATGFSMTQDSLQHEDRELTPREQLMNQMKDRLSKFFKDRLVKEKGRPEFQSEVSNYLIREIEQEEGFAWIEKKKMVEELVLDIVGYGPIQPLLEDESVTEVMVSRFDQIYAEKGGILEPVPSIRFDSDDHLVKVIENIVNPLGRPISVARPMVDARLPDGSRVNATLREISPDGATLTIRKFSKKKMTVQDYLNRQSLIPAMAAFLQASVEAGMNLVVSGGTGSGKTMLLNMISAFVPSHYAINTVEDTLELQLRQPNVRRLEARPPGMNGEGAITIRDLIKNCLRMRMDVLVVGEVRDGALVDALRAGSTGHSFMMTIHANSPRKLVDTTMPLLIGMSDMQLSELEKKQMIADSVQIIVQIARLRDGSRKITNIAYVAGVGDAAAKSIGLAKGDDKHIYLQDVFRFVQTGVENGKVQGHYEWTGFLPQEWVDAVEAKGIVFDRRIFSNDTEVGGKSTPW